MTVDSPVPPNTMLLSQPIHNVIAAAHERMEPRVRDMANLPKLAVPVFLIGIIVLLDKPVS